MKKLTLAAGFVLAISLVGCQEASTSATPSTESSLTGISAFRTGTATALAEDSSEVGSAPVVDSVFKIPLREGHRAPFLVRVDSAGHHLFARLPKGPVHKIRVDSLAHEIADSLRKAPRPLLDEATLDSMRVVLKAHKDSAKKIRDSLPKPVVIKDSLVKPVKPIVKDSLVKPTKPVVKDSLVKPVKPVVKDSLVKPVKPIVKDSTLVHPDFPKDSLVKPILAKDSLVRPVKTVPKDSLPK